MFEAMFENTGSLKPIANNNFDKQDEVILGSECFLSKKDENWVLLNKYAGRTDRQAFSHFERLSEPKMFGE